MRHLRLAGTIPRGTEFGLRLYIRSTLVDQTEFWTDFEDKTERLSSLEKFMQIRTQTEV